MFTQAFILHQPDPEVLFVVEVDASKIGVRAVISQCYDRAPKLYPCVFYSHKLSGAECNYNMDKRELLANKLNWRYWLEGTKHTFQVTY